MIEEKRMGWHGLATVRWGAVLLVLAAATLAAITPVKPNLTIFYLRNQDIWLLLSAALLLAIGTAGLSHRDTPLVATNRMLLAISVTAAAVALIGHHVILLGYNLSRDEQMADFDASIFLSGQLFVTLPEFWRDHSDALNTTFMQPATHRQAWVSSYLPLNAAFRAMFEMLGAAELAGPSFIALSAVALIGCVRRIWPNDRELPLVALLLLTGSGQVLFAGMTAYAMPAHLAMNLCWLWLFLHRNWRTDVGALLIGFIAVGLHQSHAHPLFAAPILFMLLLEREWRRAAIYFLGYCLIGAFWTLWPHWMAAHLAAADGGVPYADMYQIAMRQMEDRWSKMAANLFRFIAWQHILLLPFAIVGLWSARRNRLALGLTGGIVLTLAIRVAILPYQGHGFGYRYLHGLIGNFILLALFGWKALVPLRPQWRSLFLRMTITGWLLILPLQAWMAHRFYAPFAEVSSRIDALNADYAVIGVFDAPYSTDLVINSAFLTNRPLRLLRHRIPPHRQRHFCAGGARIALVRPSMLKPIRDRLHQSDNPKADREIDALAVSLRAAGCRINFAV